jgi:hypothetical protein
MIRREDNSDYEGLNPARQLISVKRPVWLMSFDNQRG